MSHRYSPALLLVAAWALMLSAPVDIQPSIRTDPVSDDPDDPAIWVHPTDPARSLIVGTNKVMAPKPNFFQPIRDNLLNGWRLSEFSGVVYWVQLQGPLDCMQPWD